MPMHTLHGFTPIGGPRPRPCSGFTPHVPVPVPVPVTVLPHPDKYLSGARGAIVLMQYAWQ